MNNQLQTYQQIHISGLSQKELIVLLYSGAIRFMEEAKILIEKKDVPGTHDRLNRARNIFLHLLATLNMEAGGELAQKLSGLYAYFIEKITMANVTKNALELDNILPLINDLKTAWETVDGDHPVASKQNAVNGKKRPQALSVEV